MPAGESRGIPLSRSDGREATVEVVQQRSHRRWLRAAHRRDQSPLPLQRRARKRTTLRRPKCTVSAIPHAPNPARCSATKSARRPCAPAVHADLADRDEFQAGVTTRVVCVQCDLRVRASARITERTRKRARPPALIPRFTMRHARPTYRFQRLTHHNNDERNKSGEHGLGLQSRDSCGCRCVKVMQGQLSLRMCEGICDMYGAVRTLGAWRWANRPRTATAPMRSRGTPAQPGAAARPPPAQPESAEPPALRGGAARLDLLESKGEAVAEGGELGLEG
jgi:hypothetical protein